MDGLCKRNEQMSVKRDRKMQCLFHRVEIFMSLDLAAFCSNVIHNEALIYKKWKSQSLPMCFCCLNTAAPGSDVAVLNIVRPFI